MKYIFELHQNIYILSQILAHEHENVYSFMKLGTPLKLLNDKTALVNKHNRTIVMPKQCFI